ncbi:MAG: glycosyltransferase family 4 protein [Fibrobacter sp.]|jgi:glycosyltransferase involved in cell wall biosynthesis|nr:glycosyltransferase family 4 protein [Fibrobacter sp.]
MRVALFSWESLHSINIGGLGVHVTELAAGLERRGHEIHVFTRRKQDQSHYDQIDGVHYHRVDHGISDNFVQSMDWMCQAMAHRFHEVTSMIGKFELVHAHDWLTGNVLKYISDGFGTPGILTMHSTEYGRDGNVFHDGFASWIRDTEYAACNHAKMIISISGFLAEEIQRIYGVHHSKIHVVPNGVAYHHFNGYLEPGPVKERYGIAPLDPTILAVGRMIAQKGMDLLVEAVPMVLGYFPSAKFIIAGEGPEKEGLINRANQLGVGHAIRFLGSLSRGEYSELMRSIDILALPSRNEPFGIVALEAWAAGKPVVATTAGGPREFVWHNVNGFLVDANPGGLAHGIGSLLADHDHCRALGRNGRVAVEDRFNWDTVASYTEGVYNAALC